MPRGDKTGPNGGGPRSGRQMGFCAGNNAPGFANGGGGWGRGRAWGFGPGRGFGAGNGFGRGRGSGFGGWQAYSEGKNSNNNQNLMEELKQLQEQVADLQKKLTAKDEE